MSKKMSSLRISQLRCKAASTLVALVMCACAAQYSLEEPQVPVRSGIATVALPTLNAEVTASTVTAAPGTSTTALCLDLPVSAPAGLIEQILSLNANFCTGGAQHYKLLLGQAEGLHLGVWVYALAGPFTTVSDEIAAENLQGYWQQGSSSEFSTLGMSQETARNLEFLWGKPSGNVEILPREDLSDWVWQTESAWVILPFEDLSPRLKVIRLDGISPIQKNFDADKYALSVPIRLQPEGNIDQNALLNLLSKYLPLTNRDPSKMASVVMTGVTALVRATAWGMEQEGLDAPARVIGQTLREADITHISNEASFAEDCPDPQNEHLSLKLCSKIAYMETLQAVGTDVVELTGDHLNDWGDAALLNTLALYKNASLKTFGGGEESTAANQPALFEVNGNKIAFVGCNAKDVGYPMATASTPGALACDMEAMASQIKELTQKGYQVIAGIQHTELSGWYPSERMVREFAHLAQAGAVIVSGSEAHRPQTFAFGGADGDAFLHYGLGNLFFDQDTMGGEYAEAFIDRHIFYDDHYISTEILTIQFPDSVTPVWADASTREEMLKMFFWTSGLVPTPW
jgi:poly-gamma-glutamate synthesis protein (capsule biosynthesis protein)